MKQYTLTVEPREAKGSGEARRMRLAGMVPAVVYGKEEHRMLKVSRRALVDMKKATAGTASLIALQDGQGWESLTVLQDMQQDPINDRILHVDFQTVSRGESMTANIPVQIVGEAVGVRDGGILDQSPFEVSVRCLPRNLPESLRVDGSAPAVGDSLKVGDPDLPEGVELDTDAEYSLVAVTPPAGVPETVAPEDEVEADAVPVVGEEEAAEDESADEGEKAES